MKRLVLILSFFTSLLISGCINDSSDEPGPENRSRREWYDLVRTDTFSNRQMVQEVTGYSLPLGVSMVRNSFLYHSINGTDTLTLSGAVCWPLEAVDCSEIWFESHYFSTRWDECPTQQPQGGMVISSIRNAVYVAADYQGLGLSKELYMPYLNTILLAKQNIDCFKAAMTLLKDYGPDLADDFNTYNIGYSLGGAVSMGVARQIELDPGLKEFIHLKKTLCGGGPYDQVAYFNYFLDTPSLKLDYPVAFLCAVKSIINSAPSLKQTYTYSDCFSEKIINSGILEDLDSKNYSTTYINQSLRNAGCTSLEEILSAQLLDKNSQISKAVFKEIEKLDLSYGWTPKVPILVRHSRTDTYVPFVCMESVMANWADNPNVTFEVISSAAHTDDGINFYLKLAFNNYPID